jgi:hypothetical protein
MMLQALEDFQEQHHVKFEKITKIPLEGDGCIYDRVEMCVSPDKEVAVWGLNPFI